MRTELIYTEDYALLIDTEVEICRGQYIYFNGQIELIHEGHHYPYKGNKIIAYKKLNPQAPDLDLPLLPEFYSLFGHKTIDKKIEEWFLINGYNKEDIVHSNNFPNCITTENLLKEGVKLIQEKQFTLEDMKKALNLLSNSYSQGYHRDSDINFQEATEIIQQIQQSKLPKGFIISDKFSTFEENIKNGKYY